jgi:hypothetical protein
MTLGLHGEATSALHTRSWLQQWSNDARGAGQSTLRAEEASRKADQTTRCYQVANTGRCLLEGGATTITRAHNGRRSRSNGKGLSNRLRRA